MKLHFPQPDFAVQTQRQNLDCSGQLDLKESPQEFQASTWVKLLQLPNPYSFHEALLLCQISEQEWLAWIPDHGEAVLHKLKLV